MTTSPREEQDKRVAELEEDLRRTRSFLEGIAEVASIGNWEVDLKTGARHWSRQTYILHGFDHAGPPPERQEVSARLHPHDNALLIALRDETIRTGQPFGLDVRARPHGTEYRWMRVEGRADVQAGEVVRIYGTYQDIHERKSQAEAIRAREGKLKMLENLANLSPDILAISDLGGRVVYLNPAARRIGWLPEASAFSFFPIPSVEYFLEKIWPVLTGGEVWEGEMQFLDLLRGEEFPVYQRSFLLRDSAGNPSSVATIATDLRERKRLEAEIERQRLQFVHNSKMSSLGEMAAGLAHEVNNPLAILKGNANVLAMELAAPWTDRELVAKTLKTMDATVDRIAGIIKGLRNFARDGSQDPLVPIPVARVVETTLSFCKSRFENHGIRLELGPPTDAVLRGQESQLQQALLNLLNNAFDAAKESPDKWVRLGVAQAGGVLRLEVDDSGKGIPPAIRDRVMEPFFTTKDVGKGTGLGLSICRGIVESHGGRLYIDEAAPYTRFVMEFPRSLGT